MTFAQKTQNTRPDFLLEMAQSDAEYPYPMPSYAYKAQCNACLGHNTADRLKKITAPTLVAAGACDLFVPYEKTMELCEEKSPMPRCTCARMAAMCTNGSTWKITTGSHWNFFWRKTNKKRTSRGKSSFQLSPPSQQSRNIPLVKLHQAAFVLCQNYAIMTKRTKREDHDRCIRSAKQKQSAERQRTLWTACLKC